MKNLNQVPNSKKSDQEKSSKHDVNLQQNTTLYFQIGLILCLLSAYFALEYNFEYNTTSLEQASVENTEDIQFVALNYVVEKVVEVKALKKLKPNVLIDPKIIDNDSDSTLEAKNLVDKLTKEVKEGQKVKSLNLESLEVDPIEQPVVFYLNKVENVPVYPGCEKASNNTERIKCMSNKLSKLIQRKFNTDIAAEEGLHGRQRIYIQFKILKNGKVQLVNSRATHKVLENEAARVTTKIPSMKPGIQNGKPVDVLYTLPIIFDVR